MPILEDSSGFTFNNDFFCGYSPERINPGDPLHTISTITKVTSGSTPQVASWLDQFYSSFIEAGTYSASSIMVAEAAKVIENTQRDLNIALVNVYDFSSMNIDSLDVLEAVISGFSSISSGLVGMYRC